MMDGKDARDLVLNLAGAIAAAGCLFAAPLVGAEVCGPKLDPNVELLNVTPTADAPERLTRLLEKKDPASIAAVPELSIVLAEAVKLSREERAAISVSLEYTAGRDPSVRVSLDLPNHPSDGPVRRIVDEQPKGEEVTVTRLDINVKTDEILVTPAESKGIKTARGLLVPGLTNHHWGLAIVDKPGSDLVIDTRSMRAELYVGERSLPLYRRALSVALRLARALRPREGRIFLSSPRATLERKQGQWMPVSAPR